VGLAVAQVAEAEPGEVCEGEEEDYQGRCKQEGRDEDAGQGAEQSVDGMGGAGGVGGDGRAFGLRLRAFNICCAVSELLGSKEPWALGKLLGFTDLDYGCHDDEVIDGWSALL
jgi:hypothetical protein